MGALSIRLHMESVHGTYGFVILSLDGFHIAPALQNVSFDSSKESYVVVGVDIYPKVEELAQLCDRKCEDTFDHNDPTRGDDLGFCNSRMTGEVVLGAGHLAAVLECLQMFDEELVFEGFRFVEV